MTGCAVKGCYFFRWGSVEVFCGYIGCINLGVGRKLHPAVIAFIVD
ncbi:hypothetical protein KCP76_19995 [Salmonella enterica subsp. enterica serovar Weltevreden]|nr:hypothetical protein KCP76_19995 [Salmonella enterica subsp. enterica serovar Weltevreden]